MEKGKDIFNVIKLEEKGASAKILQFQLMANEILHSEQENYQSYLSAKRIGVALAEIKEMITELEDSPRKSEFLQKLDSILSKLREYYQFHQRYWSGAEALDNEKESRRFGDRGGLPLCGVKVSGYTMLPKSTLVLAPKNHTILIVGIVSYQYFSMLAAKNRKEKLYDAKYAGF